MGVWLEDLEALDKFLRSVEADEAALENLIQVERVLEAGVTEDWAINEAVTVNLHELPTRNLEAFAQIPGEAARRYGSVVKKLSSGPRPVSHKLFWKQYEELQAEPSEFRVHPTTGNVLALPKSWETVHELQQAGEGHAAIRLGDVLMHPGFPSLRLLNRTERQARERYMKERTRYKRLVKKIEFFAELRDADAVAAHLRELDTFAPDSTDVRIIKGEMPKLRRSAERARAAGLQDASTKRPPSTWDEDDFAPWMAAGAYVFFAVVLGVAFRAISPELEILPYGFIFIGPAAWMWHWFTRRLVGGDERVLWWLPVLLPLSAAGMTFTWVSGWFGVGLALYCGVSILLEHFGLVRRKPKRFM